MAEITREVAAAVLIGTCGRVLLQQRDDVPGILYPGMIGLFGGHREGDETPLACALREIEEEIGYRISPERLRPIVQMRMDYPDARVVQGSYFFASGIPSEGLVVTEGSLLAVTLDELSRHIHRMTPSACFVTQVFLLQRERFLGSGGD